MNLVTMVKYEKLTRCMQPFTSAQSILTKSALFFFVCFGFNYVQPKAKLEKIFIANAKTSIP